MAKKENNRKNPRGIELDNIKKAEALARQESYAKLSVKEKINSLDIRLGAGVGAVKQRRKLKAGASA